MPVYKYTLKNGKTMWYANFYHTNWTGERKHICKRSFKTQREAKEYERTFMEQQNNNSDILFSSLVENYLEDMGHRLKPTTMENKRFIIDKKLLPYFGRQKVCDIDTIKIRKWQNELISYRDEKGKPFSQPSALTLTRTMPRSRERNCSSNRRLQRQNGVYPFRIFYMIILIRTRSWQTS